MIYFYFMIFVTGGTGLIGSHLLFDLTSKGIPVRALRRTNSNVEEVKRLFAIYSKNSEELFSKIEWVTGDILDIFSLSDAMNGITHVYHCAAIVSLDPSDGKDMIHNNVTGTANVVNMCLEKGVQKICYVSSVATLGAVTDKEINEDTSWNNESNSSAYAISKFLAENEVWRAIEEGLNAVIVNPTIVIGPGNWNRSSGLIFKAASKGLRWYSAGGMGYIDVRDVVKCMLLLMEGNLSKQRYILSSENLFFKEFTEILYRALRLPLPDKKAGKLLLGIAWRFANIRSLITGKRPLLTRDTARNALIKLSFSNVKIKKAIGIEFMPMLTSINDTLIEFLKYKKEGGF